MAQNRKKPKVDKIKREEVVTSRLMTALLGLFFWAFILLLLNNSSGMGFVRIVHWFVLGAGIGAGAAGVWFWYKRKNQRHEHLKVFSSGFVLGLASVFLASLCVVWIWQWPGYLYAIAFCAVRIA